MFFIKIFNRIDKTPDLGYCKIMLNAKAVGRRLITRKLGRDLTVLNETDSTNLYIKRLLPDIGEGFAVIADTQDSGHGRYGRVFCSPPGGLYMSVLLKPAVPPGKLHFITVCAGLAVVRALESLYGFTAGVKWVNDIYYNGKKLCGILAEAAVTAEPSEAAQVILGIGINTGIPAPEIKDIAISVAEITGKSCCRNALAAEVLNRLEQVLDIFSSGGQNEILSEYKERLFILGKNVTVHQNNSEFEAVVTGLTGDGALTVRESSGVERVLTAGEVSLRILS